MEQFKDNNITPEYLIHLMDDNVINTHSIYDAELFIKPSEKGSKSYKGTLIINGVLSYTESFYLNFNNVEHIQTAIAQKIFQIHGPEIKEAMGNFFMDHHEKQPPEVKAIMDTLTGDEDYIELSDINLKLKKIGWQFEFYLDGIVYNLLPVEPLELTPMSSPDPYQRIHDKQYQKDNFPELVGTTSPEDYNNGYMADHNIGSIPNGDSIPINDTLSHKQQTAIANAVDTRFQQCEQILETMQILDNQIQQLKHAAWGTNHLWRPAADLEIDNQLKKLQKWSKSYTKLIDKMYAEVD